MRGCTMRGAPAIGVLGDGSLDEVVGAFRQLTAQDALDSMLANL